MLIKIWFAGKLFPVLLEAISPCKMFKTYDYAYIWHSNEGDIPIFSLPLTLLIKYMHRIQVLLATVARVRFNYFQHNLLFFYLFFHSFCALCLETGQIHSVRIRPHPCVQNPTAAPLQRQSTRKEVLSSVCWSTFLWMKEQFQIHELLEVRQDQAFIDRVILYGMHNQSSVYKTFCTDRVKTLQSKENAKLTEPLDHSLD